ncbi:MAG TPA: Stp1/IreP family PP2C-type Ser/Thr phosphatase [Pyrinomonadaceae bacterium]|jgi:protein phosphatase|nr:Stp1/IreP family PP2C-type Ser/Thr phosphatase [Pyrinomonadaceae bacterium]
MSEQQANVRVEFASVTDRGLSQKRPLNEDSMLVDAERCIFAVADGVGGAQAGEVASQTAVEVLGEAFRHHKDGDDIEDLMEIAIQRANASIYQMSHEQRQLSMMATTIVALHLDGRRATIGHVGDSRLYRLRPDGRLERETEDHSVVEEEVRAGRMSPEQAAHHPSRNVISRALGAEQAVEVDMKTIEVEDGTIFLLCSDGITRHIPDEEINALLHGGDSLDATCEEMKRLCYERGAEDNLTAVVVRVGAQQARIVSSAPASDEDDERTLLTERTTAQASAVAGGQLHNVAASRKQFQNPLTTSASHSLPDSTAAPRAGNNKLRINTEEIAAFDAADTAAAATPPRPVETQPRSPTGRASSWFGVLLLLLLASAAAFYGGIRYQQNKAAGANTVVAANDPPAPVATATQRPASELNINDTYTRLRAAVDLSPSVEAQRMAGENGGRPLDSTDAVFLALYGRALFLSGKYPEAVEALKRANDRVDAQRAPGRDPVRLDTRLALAAAALRANNADALRLASDSFGSVIEDAGTGAATVPSVDTVPAPER